MKQKLASLVISAYNEEGNIDKLSITSLIKQSSRNN